MSTNTNMKLWRSVCVTDPAVVKPITGKQYSGSSPKPYWIVERLTEEFGPCGIGWGFTILSERYERFDNSESLHIAVVRFWYELNGKRGELEQVGQTRGSYMTAGKDGKPGRFLVDEDAPKKSVTDALVKCASYLGFAGDIFSGRWDDSKYVAHAAAEWQERKEEEHSKAAAEERAKWLAKWLDEQATLIEAAGSEEELKERWTAFYKAAKKAGDADAIATITPIKDRILAALKQKEPA